MDRDRKRAQEMPEAVLELNRQELIRDWESLFWTFLLLWPGMSALALHGRLGQPSLSVGDLSRFSLLWDIRVSHALHPESRIEEQKDGWR